MREEQIESIIDILEAVWKDNPNLRLGQLITNVVPEGHMSFYPDHQLERRLREYYQDSLEGIDEKIDSNREELSKKFDEVGETVVGQWNKEVDELDADVVDQWVEFFEVSPWPEVEEDCKGEDEDWFEGVQVGDMVESSRYGEGLVARVFDDKFSVNFNRGWMTYDWDGVNVLDSHWDDVLV